MEYEGDPKVLTNHFRVRNARARGETLDLRLVIIVLSGTLRGTYAGGQIMELEEAGLSHVYLAAIGCSTGAPAIGYMLGKQAALGTSVYTVECTTPAFLSISRAVRCGSISGFADLDYLARVFRGEIGSKGIDQSLIAQVSTEAWVSVTDVLTGEGRLIDIKRTVPDMIEPMRASFAIPGISRPIRIDGRDCCDGTVAHPLPVCEAHKAFRPTDVLVLANRAKGYREEGLLRSIIERRALKEATPALRSAIATRQQRFDTSLRWLRAQPHFRYGILWSDTEVKGFTRDPVQLNAAVARSRAHMRGLLTRAAADA